MVFQILIFYHYQKEKKAAIEEKVLKNIEEGLEVSLPFVSYLHFILDGSFSARLALHSLLLFILGCWFGRKRQRSCCNQTFSPWGFCGGICRGLDWSLHSQEKRKRILRESRFWMLYVLFCTPKQKLLVNIYINFHSNFIYI